VGELDSGDRAVAVVGDEAGDAGEGCLLPLVPQARVVRADPALGADRGGLGHDETGAADRAGAQMTTCQSVGAPTSGPSEAAEYWHIGDIQARLGIVSSRNVIGSNSILGVPPAHSERHRVRGCSRGVPLPYVVAMATERALVLGGGGVTGVGWEWGVIAGLAAAGIRLLDADLVVGTSAGSVVAAQLTSGRDVSELYEAQLRPPTSELAARLSPLALLRFGVAMARSRDAQQFRARIGAMALAAKTVSEADRRDVISARLPSESWPDRRVLITAVDAETGEFVTFDRDSGVSLVDAVGASCAVPTVWPPVTIGGRRYIDGGMRSGANADLAADADRIVVIARSPPGPATSPASPTRWPS
jgi:NTE family protein